jgi:hypothetical protein
LSSSIPRLPTSRATVPPATALLRSLLDTPLDRTLSGWWARVDNAHKNAFLVAVFVNVLAFGFEMTNLTLHHDDVIQIFIQDTILGHYLGRFGVGWLHYYTQNHYFMPFLQMSEGILMMSVYGVLVAHFWGVRRATDTALICAILCVFPYMAQVYQYNTSMATYPAAHLLAALAVVLSTRARLIPVATASITFVAAMSIYQAVVANAATIFVIWLLSRHLFGGEGKELTARETVKSTIAVLLSVIVAGIIYLAIVSTMHIEFDAYQSAEDAFTLREAFNLQLAVPAIWTGTRSFFLWPERYFPDYLKAFQLVFLVGAGVVCLWLPGRVWAKIAAAALIVLASFTPRVLQLLHPEGTYHSLTLTAYAVLIAGAVMIVNRAGGIGTRNASIVLASFLVAGYVMQCNWMSTVNYLNTSAHFATLTQVLARVRSIPDAHWDGKTIAVVGTYEMSSEYPFKQYEAVAPKFMDAKHMDKLARLMRDEAIFIAADQTMPKVLAYAATHLPWPDPGSVSVVDGMGVVVFANSPR